MINCSNNNQIVSFGNIKPTIRMGEQAIRELRKEFPFLKSNTKIETLILAQKDNRKYRKIVKKLQVIDDKYCNQVDALRTETKGTYQTLNQFIKSLKHSIKKYGVANCGEEADLVQYNLLKKGVNAHKIGFDIIDKKTHMPNSKTRACNDHSFVVLGLAGKDEYCSPKYWGNKAVIVDPWAKIVDSSFNAIEKYKEMFKFNPDKEEMFFECIDRFSVEDYNLQKRLKHHKK